MKTVKVIALEFTTNMEYEDPYQSPFAQLMREWEESESGKWLIEHSNPRPFWERTLDHSACVNRYAVKTYLTPELHFFWKLKYE